MQLHIVSPTLKKTYETEWFECNTAQGNFVIQPEHAPTVLILSPNSQVIFMAQNSQANIIIIVKQGIVEITRQEITLIITQE